MHDFEWLIVDDGSEDNSHRLIDAFKQNKDFFSITYYKQMHGGKHRAINNGLKLAQGELFFIVDSDDFLTDDALERIVHWEGTIKDRNGEYCGLCGLSGYTSEQVIGTTFNGEFFDCTVIEQFGNGISGDHAHIFYTRIFQKYPYPEFEGEWHIPPRVSYIRMAKDGYKMRFFNEIIYIAEYREDGLTKMGDKKILENFEGYTLRTKELIRTNIPLKRKIEIIGKYTYLAKQKCIGVKEVSNKLNTNILSTFFCGLLASVFYKIKKNIRSGDERKLSLNQKSTI